LFIKILQGHFFLIWERNYDASGVELRCDGRSFDILQNMGFLKAIIHATEDDWKTEYNDWYFQ